MLDDMEGAMAGVEGQEEQAVAAIKDGWQSALDAALKILSWPGGLVVQYNPAIWRSSRYPVGMRLLSSPWESLLVFEFATPNAVLPFDCLGPRRAKEGVMLHEIAHLIDDARWGFDMAELVHDSGSFITREQRAEITAFACDPVGVFEANLALIESTAKMVGADLGGHSRALAAIETMGHAGLAGEMDPVQTLKGIQDKGVPVDRIIEGYLSTFYFSMAGLASGPDLNEARGLGIKRSEGLRRANAGLCRYLRDEVDLNELQGILDAVDYFAFSEGEGEGGDGEGAAGKGGKKAYDPLDCVDQAFINSDLAGENLSQARKYFEGEACFKDILDAVQKLEGRFRGLDKSK